MVYISLREGAKAQQIPFDLNLLELLNLIDIQDYVNILTAMKESMGAAIPVNSITNN